MQCTFVDLRFAPSCSHEIKIPRAVWMPCYSSDLWATNTVLQALRRHFSRRSSPPILHPSADGFLSFRTLGTIRGKCTTFLQPLLGEFSEFSNAIFGGVSWSLGWINPFWYSDCGPANISSSVSNFIYFLVAPASSDHNFHQNRI